MGKCEEKMETYSRVVGFFTPIYQWNKGKQHEFDMRKTFNVDKALAHYAKEKEKKSVFST